MNELLQAGRPLPRVTLPPQEGARLRAACSEALHRFADPVLRADGQRRWKPRADAPELIIVLLRAAEPPFRALEALAAARGVGLPPVIRAHIGRELQARYFADGGDLTPWPISLLDEEAQEEIARPFEAWLQADPYAQSVVCGMRTDAEAHQLIPERVLVVDDCTFEGGTWLAAHSLVRQAFELVDEPEIAFLGAGNLSSAIRAAVAIEPLTRAQVSQAAAFFSYLGKGYLETPTSCVRLESPEHLAAVGQLVRADAPASLPGKRQSLPGDPYPMFKALYGDEALLGFFGTRVVQACVDVVLAEGADGE